MLLFRNWWTENMEEMKAFWLSQHRRICQTMANVHPLYLLFGFSEEQLRLFGNLMENDQKEAA
jgi:hypothetical protein